jgi:hypothetical protein
MDGAVGKQGLTHFFAMVGMISGFSVGGVIGILGAFHFGLLYTNKSTIEMTHAGAFNVFALPTWKDNLTQICGAEIWPYFLPVKRKTEFAGLRYPVTLRSKDGREMLHTNQFVV